MASERITVLMKNNASGYGRLVEHGRSFRIEVDGMSPLFDTGQDNALQASFRGGRWMPP
jgi:metal-dependent hydrolase (beta-lactamase superfamily II)